VVTYSLLGNKDEPATTDRLLAPESEGRSRGLDADAVKALVRSEHYLGVAEKTIDTLIQGVHDVAAPKRTQWQAEGGAPRQDTATVKATVNPRNEPRAVVRPTTQDDIRFEGDDGVTPSLHYEVISFEPRAYLFPRLLTDAECEAIVSAADNLNSQNHGVYKDVRTSSNQKISFQVLNKPEIKHVLRRVANASGVSVGHFEGIEVIRYDNGQKYQSHHDYFSGPENTILTNDDRIATMLIYLREPTRGGETIFPWADTGTEIGKNGWPSAYHDFTRECEKLQTYDDQLDRGAKVIPKKGGALLFFNYNHVGKPDPYSQHGGCPVLEGQKYTATVWMWGRPHGACPPAGSPLLRGVSERDRLWNTNADEPSVCIRNGHN